MKKLITIPIIAIVIFSIIPIKIFAQSSGGAYGLILENPKFEYSLNPGESVSDKIGILNDYENPDDVETLYPLIYDFTSDGVSGTPILLDKGRNKPAQTLEDWITIDKDSLTLKKDQRDSIKFTLNVPKNAEAGSYYAAIIFSPTKDNLTPSQTQVGLQGKIGSLILLTVKGDLRSDLTVDDLRAVDYTKNVPFLNIFEFQPVIFQLSVRTTGNAYVIPKGDLFVNQGDLANSIYTTQINPNDFATLANSSRTYEFEWNDGVFKYDTTSATDQSRIFKVHLENIPKFYIGRYNATVKILYKDRKTGELKSIDKSVEFWIIPWKLILILILIIVAIYFVVRRKGKGRKQKEFEVRS